MTTTEPASVKDREIHLRTCPLCEAMCGLEVHVEDERVALIRADRDDVWSKGYLCPKGTTLGHLHHDPDRLRAPMVREGDDVARGRRWDEAFARCEELLAPVVAEHGIEAVTAYVGNPLAHNFSLGRYVGDPHRHVGHPDDLLGRHRRPVAQERQLAPACTAACGRSRCPTSAAPTCSS